MDILVFSDDYNWDGHPSSSMHIARHLLTDNRVFWFNVIYRPPRASWVDVRRTALKLREMAGFHINRGKFDGVIIRSPITVPLFIQPFRMLNRLLFRRLLRNIDVEFKLKMPVILVTNPFAVDFVLETHPWPAFYYCVDDYSEYPGINAVSALALEKELLGVARGVAATASHLLDSRRTGKHDIYLPHGVDVEHFAAVTRSRKHGTRPVIGFFGLISDWIDLEYVAAIAKLRRDWSIELIGRVDTNVQILHGLDNVNFRAPVSFGDLPKAASNFDVALIPFRINSLTLAVNPLKLLEYFAMGLPVVSTNLPEVARYAPTATIAATPQEAVRAIQEHLESDSIEQRQLRISIAKANSWSTRATCLLRWMESGAEVREGISTLGNSP